MAKETMIHVRMDKETAKLYYAYQKSIGIEKGSNNADRHTFARLCVDLQHYKKLADKFLDKN